MSGVIQLRIKEWTALMYPCHLDAQWVIAEVVSYDPVRVQKIKS